MTTVGVSTNCKHILHTTTGSWPAINTHTHMSCMNTFILYLTLHTKILFSIFAVQLCSDRCHNNKSYNTHWHSLKAVLILAGNDSFAPLCAFMQYSNTHTCGHARAYTHTHTRKKEQRKLSTVVRAKTTYNIGGNK